jgi:Glycosyltransferase 61
MPSCVTLWLLCCLVAAILPSHRHGLAVSAAASKDYDCQEVIEYNQSTGGTIISQTIQLQDYLELGTLYRVSDICYNMASHESVHRGGRAHSLVLPGATFLVDDWQALGHAISELRVLEYISRGGYIDRIVIERNVSMPNGQQDFSAWILHMLTVATRVQTNSSGVQLYVLADDQPPITDKQRAEGLHKLVRYRPIPFPLGAGVKAAVGGGEPALDIIDDVMCADVLIWRNKDSKCLTCLSAEGSRQYRTSLDKYTIEHGFNMSILSHPSTLTPFDPRSVNIVFVSRGEHYRHVANLPGFVGLLAKNLHILLKHTGIPLSFTVIDSTQPMSFLEQVRLCQQADVIIATHGGFLANIIHMREHALVVEVTCPRGSEAVGGGWSMYKNIAFDFNVLHVRVYAPDLKSDSNGFDVPFHEMQRGVRVIASYLLSTRIANLSDPSVIAASSASMAFVRTNPRDIVTLNLPSYWEPRFANVTNHIKTVNRIYNDLLAAMALGTAGAAFRRINHRPKYYKKAGPGNVVWQCFANWEV